MTEPSFLTRAIKTGMATDETFGSLMPPLYPTSNYVFGALGDSPAYDYTRAANPTRDALAEAISTLEHGVATTVTSSGMAAILLVLDAFVPVGGRVVAPHDCYGGTWRLLDSWTTSGRVACEFVDLTDPDAAATALARPADLVLVETPSNPLLRITDVAAVSELAHEAGALVVADNTIASPLLQQPLTLGADLVVHSTTKFINGHSDVVGGCVTAKDADRADRLRFWGKVLGVTGSPWDAWLTLRGLRTIDARMRVHLANASRVVETLRAHRAVGQVFYPGLPDHPHHDLAARQQSGFGSLVSFELPGGTNAARRFVEAVRVFDLAESLGGVESLVAHPALMTHAGMSPEARAAAGVTDGLLRLSVGVELADDLVADLTAGLDAAHDGHR